MAPDRFRACLDAACTSAARAGHDRIAIVIQGGEPLLAGRARFGEYLVARDDLEQLHGLSIECGLQTNGMLLDKEWCDLLSRLRCEIGISLDGPPSVHDQQRIDRSDRGTSKRVVAGVTRALDHGLRVGTISVAQPDVDGAEVYAYIRGLGVQHLHFLLPARNWDSPDQRHASFTSYLAAAFSAWLVDPEPARVDDFTSVVRALRGLPARPWLLVNRPSEWLVFLPDGSIEQGDCYNLVQLSRRTDPSLLEAIVAAEASHLYGLHRAAALPDVEECRRCEFASACNGGFIPFRYSAQRGFDNPSVYCSDTKKFFAYARDLIDALGVAS